MGMILNSRLSVVVGVGLGLVGLVCLYWFRNVVFVWVCFRIIADSMLCKQLEDGILVVVTD